jgi:hypothetical protein
MPMAVIPAKAGIHLRLLHQSNMDSRFRGNDGHGGYIDLDLVSTRLLRPKTCHFAMLHEFDIYKMLA